MVTTHYDVTPRVTVGGAPRLHLIVSLGVTCTVPTLPYTGATVFGQPGEVGKGRLGVNPSAVPVVPSLRKRSAASRTRVGKLLGIDAFI